MRCYWRQCSAYRHCPPLVLPTSTVSTKRRRAQGEAADRHAARVAEAEAEVAAADAAAVERGDRFGLGWRPELAAGILAHLDRIDLVEIIADDWFEAGRRELRALGTLGAQVPMVLHGVGPRGRPRNRSPGRAPTHQRDRRGRRHEHRPGAEDRRQRATTRKYRDPD